MQKPLRFSIIPLRFPIRNCWIFSGEHRANMLNRQFVDFGTQYRTSIFYHNKEQGWLAEALKEELKKSGKFYKPIVAEIKPASTFFKVEEYH